MKKGAVKKRKENSLSGYFFVAPATILLFVFIFIPIIISIVLSFTVYNGFALPKWVGIKNYQDAIINKTFIRSMENTIVFSIVTVPIQTILSLSFAAILAAKFKNSYGQFVRGTMFIPALCSAVLAGTVFYYLFASDSEAMINYLLSIFGFEKVNWLGRKTTALAVVCIVSIWKNVGYFLVMFYAGIMEIPASLYEASRVDGASSMQQFIYITIPSIKPIIYLVLSLSTIWSFQVFDITFSMTEGGPGNATISPVMVIYREAFKNGRIGFASALACILAIIIMIVTLTQRKAFNEKVGVN